MDNIYRTNCEGDSFTAEEVISFLYNEKNIGACDHCPYNDHMRSQGQVGPCGQQHCWVEVTTNR